MGRQCWPNSLLLLIETSVELQTGRRTALDPDLLQATGDPGQELAAVFRPVRTVLFILKICHLIGRLEQYAIDFLRQDGAATVTVELALAWSTNPTRSDPYL